MRTLIASTVAGVILASVGVWQFQEYKYLGKMASREVTYLEEKLSLQEVHKQNLTKQQEKSDDAFQAYTKQIDKLEDIAAATNATISSLRKQTSDLRDSIDKLPDETLRAYATEASESLLDLSIRYSEVSRKADEYYIAWQTLDRAWPENKVKEIENE